MALKTATALGRTFVVDLVLRNEDRLVCHELGWRGNPGNLLVTDRVPHASDKLGPANVEETANTNRGKPGYFKSRRSQSFTKLSTAGANELRSQLPKQHRSPSPDPTHLEGTKSMALKVSLDFWGHSCEHCIGSAYWWLILVSANTVMRPPLHQSAKKGAFSLAGSLLLMLVHSNPL